MRVQGGVHKSKYFDSLADLQEQWVVQIIVILIAIVHIYLSLVICHFKETNKCIYKAVCIKFIL